MTEPEACGSIINRLLTRFGTDALLWPLVECSPSVIAGIVSLGVDKSKMCLRPIERQGKK